MACVMLVAAEPSGDALGAALAFALRERLGDKMRLVGVGGPLMAGQGIDSPFDITPLSVLGVTDAVRVYPLVRRRAREAGEIAARERPDVAVLIDSWGFNLRVARAIRRANRDVFIFKYVAPQVWATRPGRARTLARAVDHLLTIHGFDAPWFEKAGLSTTFVGNPVLADGSADAEAGSSFRREISAGPDDPILVVAPGSRSGEVRRLMRPFADATQRMLAERPRLKIVVLAADAMAGEVATATAWPFPAEIVIGESRRRSAMAAATAALACSGTVTTQLAMAGAPVVVAYRLDPFTAPIARLLIRTPYITLFNVAARRMVAPELIQEACTGPRLAAALAPLLDNPAARERQIKAQFEAVEHMRGAITDPAGAAADVVIARLAERATV